MHYLNHVCCKFTRLTLTSRLLHWQVTEGTVDEGVYGLAKQKMKLDAAVLKGITAGSHTSDSTTDVAHMGQLLQALVTSSTDGAT